MGVLSALTSRGYDTAYHFAPLIYAPGIFEADKLLSKSKLLAKGLKPTHFRPSSKGRDVEQGFIDYVHLMNRESFPLRENKLQRRLPHVLVCVPLSSVANNGTLLCRYNIAKHRKGENDKFVASSANGRFLPGLKVPVADDHAAAVAMIDARVGKERWLELLVLGEVPVAQASVVCFSDEEAERCLQLLALYGHPGRVKVSKSSYVPPRPNVALDYVKDVVAGNRSANDYPKLEFD